MQSLADGSSITYPGEPFFQVKEKRSSEPKFEQYTSVRSADGWSTEIGDTLGSEEVPAPVLPPAAEGTNPKIVEETPSGSKVFFLDEANLLPGYSNSAPNEPDLYEYTVPSPTLPNGHLEDLTIDTNVGPHGEHEHADVQGILGVGGEGSEEGAFVYFVAGGKLAPGASTGGCTSGAGGEARGTGCNLYLRHDGVMRLIATRRTTNENEGKESLGAGDVD
jgi:hypothetical protein